MAEARCPAAGDPPGAPGGEPGARHALEAVPGGEAGAAAPV